MNLSIKDSLSLRFLASILGLTLLGLALVMTTLHVEVTHFGERQTNLAREALNLEQHHSEALQSRALSTKGDLLGRFMARTAPDVILTYDLDLIARYQREAVADPDIAYALYLDPEGVPMMPLEEEGKISGESIIENRYPIDVEGKRLGYVLIGLDTRGLGEANRVAGERIQGAIAEAQRIAHDGRTRFQTILAGLTLALLLLLGVFFHLMFRRQVIRPINDTAALILKIAQGEGDLRQRLPVRGRDEINRLRESVNAFSGRLAEMVRGIVADMRQLAVVSSDLNEAAAMLVADMDSERARTNQVGAGIGQMTAMIQQIAVNAARVADAARAGDDRVRDGKHLVAVAANDIETLAREIQAVAEVMARLEQASERIGSVLDVIVSISDQTDLLALNAAIEAARAGDHGRGFAVVADEVRALSVRTQESTREVREIIEQVRSGTLDAIDTMERSQLKAAESVAHTTSANTALEGIHEAVSRITRMITDIASAAEKQSGAAQDVNQQVVIIHQLGNKTARSAKTAEDTSRHLSALAGSLDTLVGRFRV